ncbi:phiSA1p31-related protein [Streptomyces sp. NPDC101455]|uniref:phiSA1p31-related protein n=1 Tax=Streptomyces sp. NPDC101455 TaxID=3366142 RepID=UPI0038150053
MISILAKDLHLMFKQVAPHMDDPENGLPFISSIRLESRDGWLYAVATDRFTVGAARRPITDGGNGTGHIPAYLVPAVEAVLGAAADHGDKVSLTLPTDDGQLVLTVPGQEKLAVEYEPADYKGFPNWRKILHDALTAEPCTIPIAGLTTSFLARWQHAAEKLAFWQSAPNKPLVFLDHDGYFAGMQMPTRADDKREDAAHGWIDATVPTATVDGSTYDLDKTWSDKHGDPWTYSGKDTPDGMPLMVIDGIEDDPHPLDRLVWTYGPLYARDL